jgi:penicillin-binding protein 1A
VFSFKNLVKIFSILTFLALFALLAVYMSIKAQLPSVDTLKDLKWQTPMQIFSLDGKLISQFGEKKRIPLTLEQMPSQLINALLATEDDRFYLHFGVDPIGMTRAIVGQLTGQNKGGASTITMQVARNFFLSRDVTYIRKIREIFTAFHIEHLLSKDEILTLYMNKIELGHRAFGYGAAAQVYYGKDVKELTLAQIAVLAGLPKAPSTLNPISNPIRAKQRRHVVLQRMLSQGYINQTEFDQANAEAITARKHGTEIELDAPYIAEMAHQEMLNRYGKEQAYTGGYKVFTTVPSKLQTDAKQALVQNLFNYDQRHGYRGALKNILPTGFVAELLVDPSQQSATVAAAAPTEQIALPAVIPQAMIQVIPEFTFEQQQLLAELNSVKQFESLQPAIVTRLGERSAGIVLERNHQLADGEIAWSDMAWARSFINDDKQGPAPSKAADILALGDLVYVEANGTNQYKLSQLPQVSSALVALSPDDGAIKALVGGFSFKQSQYNRAIQAKRQVGSNIKPFIYSAAFEQGVTLASAINDAPINQWDRRNGIVWRPQNSPPNYVGPLRVRLGLAQSKNVISVRLLRKVGLSPMIDHLSSFGFAASDLPRNESLALGSASFTPLEVATGFATFANGGFLIAPYLIARIEDAAGNILYQAEPAVACDPCTTSADNYSVDDDVPLDLTLTVQPTVVAQAPRVISEQNAFLVTQALNSVIWGADWSIKPGWQGTGWRARVLKRRDIAGKTGTTNESKDAWFSGYSRRMVATTWIGFDDHQRDLGQSSRNRNLEQNPIIGKEEGAKSALPAWIEFMNGALADLPIEPFRQPDGIVSVRIDKASGKLSSKTDKSSTFEYFISGTEPSDYVTQDHSNEIFDGAQSAEQLETQQEAEIF